MQQPVARRAARFIETSRFLWYQRFELAPGIWTPGEAETVALLEAFGLPDDLRGVRALDVGTANGAIAFALEQRGARVTAIDIYDEDHFGFRALAELLRSSVAFRRASIYEVLEVADGGFDLVVLFGVLYHLRHPLLALDQLRQVATGRLLVETAVCDHNTDLAAPAARFYRTDELGSDASNWFAPNVAGLVDWVESSGFSVASGMPASAPSRAALDAEVAPGLPEYRRVSYERPIVGLKFGG